MNCPWFWYVARCSDGAPHVKIHTEAPGYVRGAHWIVPMRSTDGPWRMTMKPAWQVEGKNPYALWDNPPPSAVIDCEWVCVGRERPAHYDCDESCEYCYPPPREVEHCKCCGQEIY
jgi:hypothetical protein